MSEPAERDWFGLVAGGGPCPDCGLDAAAVAVADLGPSLLGEARRWEQELAALAAPSAENPDPDPDPDAADAALRRRPDPATWSAIEYAAHVGGVFRVFAERVARIRAEDEPELGWWDHEAAVTEDRYAEMAVADVHATIADGAVALALGLPRLDDPAAWARAGTRRSGERFTIEGMARFALHESAHHRVDARRSAGREGPAPGPAASR